MGNGFNANMDRLKSDLTGTVSTAKAAGDTSNLDPALASNGQPDGSAIIGPPAAGQQQVCYKSGWCVNVPVTQNTALTVTTGSMGSQMTNQFASVFDQIAMQLAQNQNPDPQTLALVTELANLGHDISYWQKALWVECSAGANCTYNASTGVSWGGTGYGNMTAPKSQNSLGQIELATSAFSSKNSELSSYLKKQPDVLPSYMQEIINSQSSQIMNIAGAYQTSNLVVTTSPTDPNVSIANWSLGYDAQLVDQNANTICQNGGDTSMCFKLTP
ncbi:MAG TPA: hypothetical protein V6C52_11685 [Coleofasciculaceae cyanobacterium]